MIKAQFKHQYKHYLSTSNDSKSHYKLFSKISFIANVNNELFLSPKINFMNTLYQTLLPAFPKICMNRKKIHLTYTTMKNGWELALHLGFTLVYPHIIIHCNFCYVFLFQGLLNTIYSGRERFRLAALLMMWSSFDLWAQLKNQCTSDKWSTHGLIT